MYERKKIEIQNNQKKRSADNSLTLKREEGNEKRN
ncbi:MAG: hypothetical protein US84_C0017G0004 [Candidatus Falkowbacteria bacterium GW2011_GWF1_38_22]|uniref:Uncharacterized protein n=1 Tax=Candidatus Falkowbacteria bacterium GW2011_GWE1_38_31 TaxID=1618638 RepID=A0A0G0MW01_9BACT|nr:MAG: hypothetical protein US73_C0018G0011 [Candidatus Falkowbacteria bacterium GW2011_GWF2_38_1205]KKQ62406.1 MAG: hypothetical protein US84_C0017G0004 [Candidatus Falkowbacteria bacterium GW2011_GWF1_38_22]KKQ64461.1 MAG: hypothetical protein US87_C0017G0004 [Candidatus Falkowbacteria bacterium GW2011_GWE2_38_254]KKQ69096.1 MAG: hypothetical protein US91_C0016G0004 [Candidatus Falkowbacteria bacterium GW2011_GWE1_38_31]